MRRVLFWLLTLSAAAWAQSPLLTLPGDLDPLKTEWFVSPDGGTAGYWAAGKLVVGNQTVLADEVSVARAADGSWCLFSPDSRRSGYATRKGQKWTLWLSGQALKATPQGNGLLTFIPRSQGVAYVAQGGKVMFEGVATPADKGFTVEHLRVSADGRVLAYAAHKGQDWYLAMSSSLWRCHEKVVQMTLSPNGTQLAWVQQGPGGQTLVLNGRTLGVFKEVKRLVFSPDGERWAFVVVPQGGGNSFILREDKEQVAKPGVDVDYPVFDPASSEWVWGESQGGKWVAMGRLHPESPDGLNAIPLAYTPAGHKLVLLVLDGPQTVQVGDHRSAPFDALTLPLRFGKDGGISFGVRRGRDLGLENLTP